MAGIKLKNIQKSYQVEDRNVPVLNGIDLDIPQGQITVILGQSGCGKTTLLRLTGGLEPADSGEILWEAIIRRLLYFRSASDALADGLGQCGIWSEKGGAG